MSARILVVRGGAIGDFILTLPALRLLRENFPGADVEILGYKHIVALAEQRYYASRTRSIEYAGLARFFIPNAELPGDLVDYFRQFDHVISYLFDPDGFFAANVKRAGARHVITGTPKIMTGLHAAHQLAKPLEQYALYLDDTAARVFPHEEDVQAASVLLGNTERPRLVVHPGSGGKEKNWEIERWIALLQRFRCRFTDMEIVVVGGEADGERISALRSASIEARYILGAPLPHLAAVLARATLFVGHDSGISHLAAAAGAPCILLFGPTDPEVWAPGNEGVTVLRPSSGNLRDQPLEPLWEEISHRFS
jgi:heptosyltransferase-3